MLFFGIMESKVLIKESGKSEYRYFFLSFVEKENKEMG